MIYFIRSGDSNLIKVGSTRDVRRRLGELRTGSSDELTLLAMIPGGRATEQSLHNRFRVHHLRGEWFRLTDEQIAKVLCESIKFPSDELEGSDPPASDRVKAPDPEGPVIDRALSALASWRLGSRELSQALGMTPRLLAIEMAKLGAYPRDIRFDDGVRRGYYRTDLENAQAYKRSLTA